MGEFAPILNYTLLPQAPSPLLSVDGKIFCAMGYVCYALVALEVMVRYSVSCGEKNKRYMHSHSHCCGFNIESWWPCGKKVYPTPKQMLKNNLTTQQCLFLLQSCGNSKTDSPT